MAKKQKLQSTNFDELISDQAGLVSQGATQETIKSVEESIGFLIPEPLKSFLCWRDGGMIAAKGFIVFSAGKGIHRDETLIAANSNRGPDFPIVSIARDAIYDFGFKKSDLKMEDPPIYSFTWEMGKPEKIASSFSAWIKWAEKNAAR